MDNQETYKYSQSGIVMVQDIPGLQVPEPKLTLTTRVSQLEETVDHLTKRISQLESIMQQVLNEVGI